MFLSRAGSRRTGAAGLACEALLLGPPGSKTGCNIRRMCEERLKRVIEGYVLITPEFARPSVSADAVWASFGQSGNDL